jgi:argininosuccinate synthase
MEPDRTKDYEQNDATGFIRLNGLRLRVNSTVNGAKNLKGL